MIIAEILGGLGNQMFQYAAARALALRRGLPLYLDTSSFAERNIHQGFELTKVFVLDAIAPGSDLLRQILGWQAPSMIRRLLIRQGLQVIRKPALVIEPSFDFWPGINKVPEDCYLQGYWQSEKYFSDAEMQIRGNFTFRQPLTGLNADLADKISSENAISLHVRRGDYVGNRKTLSVHGLCDAKYYLAALGYMAERIENPVIYIFSDDIPWVRNNLEIVFQHHFVDHNRGSESWNDMRLMSLCRNNIIANSSFSWWGAWLNADPNKIVIAPRNWFANGRETPDLCSDKWVRL